jgi:hypothetical protein
VTPNPAPIARLDVGLDVTLRALYLCLVVAMLWAVLPGMRAIARRWLERQIYAYRVGRWPDDFNRLPAWKREALHVRGKAPRAARVKP